MSATRRIQLIGLAAVLLSTGYADADRYDLTANTLWNGTSGGSHRVTMGSQVGGSAVVIDGDKHPEAIPDELAYRHFLKATSVRANASLSERQVPRLVLDRVGFDEADRLAYLTVTGRLRQRLVRTTPLAAELPVVNEAVQQLRGQLTSEGFQRLDFHVKDHVKRHIKIYSSAR